MQRKYEYRRKLPHYQPDFKAFFITFSTHHRWILPESVLHIVIDTCLAGNDRKFALHAVVVMPAHVHMALTRLVVAEYGGNRCRMNHLQWRRERTPVLHDRIAGSLSRHYCWRACSCKIISGNIQRPGGARWVGENLASYIRRIPTKEVKNVTRAQAFFTPCGK